MNKPTTIMADRGDCGARFTSDEFGRMIASGAFDGMKIELLWGELQRMTPPTSEQARLQMRLGLRFAGVIAEDLVLGGVGIRLGDHSTLACDLALLIEPVAGRAFLRPDQVRLVVEIASTTQSRDMGHKRLAYAMAAIPTYWVIDTQRAIVHVYADPSAGDYADVSSVRFGRELAVPGTDRTILLG